MSPFALILEGLVGGAVPGLLAAGLALVHRTTGVLSFAHGAVGTAAAFLAWRLGRSVPLGPAGSALVALLAGAAATLPLAPLTRRLARDRHRLAILLTLGWGLALEAALLVAFGARPKAFLHIFSEVRPVRLPGGGTIAAGDLILLGIVLTVTAGTAAWLRGTRTGLALRAAGANREAAATLGLPLGRLETGAWALSGGAAGLAGWLLAPRLGLEPAMMWSPMVVGFVAAALGGIDHPGRALIAGLGLGLAERTAYLVLAPEWVPAARWAGLALALALARR